MKKIINYLVVLLMCVSATGFSQDERVEAGRKVQGLKIAYITKQLNLTSEEAEKFWPVYNSYVSDLRKARQERKDDVLQHEENVLNIRKKYRGDFKKVLNTDDRVYKVLTIERDFNNVLRKELQHRMQMRKGKDKDRHP
jgi:hypothetical protein